MNANFVNKNELVVTAFMHLSGVREKLRDSNSYYREQGRTLGFVEGYAAAMGWDIDPAEIQELNDI